MLVVLAALAGSGSLGIAAIVVGAVAEALCVLAVRQLHVGTRRVLARQEEIVARMHTTLGEGMQAFADGDMTHRLVVATAEPPELPDNEIGRLMRGVEGFRDLAKRTYVTYNATAEKLRGLLEQVAQTAHTVDSASEEVRGSSETACWR